MAIADLLRVPVRAQKLTLGSKAKNSMGAQGIELCFLRLDLSRFYSAHSDDCGA